MKICCTRRPARFQNTIFRPSVRAARRETGSTRPRLTGGPSRAGISVTFDDVSLEHFIDAPLDAGVNYKPVAVVERTATRRRISTRSRILRQEFDASFRDSVIAHYRKLVHRNAGDVRRAPLAQLQFLADAVGRSCRVKASSITSRATMDRRWRLSHQSGIAFERGGDLLSHEFNHSWDGKYRMPAGFYPSNLQITYDDSLLMGVRRYDAILRQRDGVARRHSQKRHVSRPRRATSTHSTITSQGRLLAHAWATMRRFRTVHLQRTARLRRRTAGGEDFLFSEAELMWLKVDSIIREQTNDESRVARYVCARIFRKRRDDRADRRHVRS
jgi:predicted metalloprotease with PDZ domain